jgi:hypothetical protein
MSNLYSSVNNAYLSMVSGFCAFISLTNIQPVLTFVASIVAIVSGIYSIVRKKRK